MTTSPAEPVPAADPEAGAEAEEAPATPTDEPPVEEAKAEQQKAEQPKAGDASKTTDIVPGPGGVMTDEVGVVTGELTLRTELAGEKLTLRVQYKDAEEWYKVTGGRAEINDPADLEAVHKIAVGLLNRPEG